MKSIFLLLPKLFRPKALLKTIIDLKANGDNIRFGVFAACMNALYKVVLCVLRRYSENQGVNAFAAGFIAGLATIIDEGSRRTWLALYLLARSFECLLNLLEMKGYKVKINHGEQLVFTVAGSFLKYCFGYEKDLIDQATQKFFYQAC